MGIDVVPPVDRLAMTAAGSEESVRMAWRRRPGAAALPVALVCMPFASHVRPSLQVGLLASIARRAGFPAATIHANLELAARIGQELYGLLSEHRGFQLGDWLFSRAAFPDDAVDPDAAFIEAFSVERVLAAAVDDPASPHLDGVRDRLVAFRDAGAAEFVDHLVEQVAWERFRVVAFTSTFQQSLAAIALARALKRRHPEIVTVFGGANLEGPMGPELVRAVDAIDYGVGGEGDLTFPNLLAALLEGDDPAGLPGVICRRDGAVSAQPAPPLLRDLDALPVPDYDEFFARAELLGLLPRAARREVRIPFEGARGCWWGEKHHCTFCGLNAAGMAFRGKTTDRLRGELAELATRYRSFELEAVDNILAMPLLRELFPELARTEADYSFFFEVKANLTRDQLRTLAEGGVRRIQPGIESLSTPVLRLMRKGVTAAQNVNVLRWATYYGMSVAWNLIWGFPGERVEHYEKQLALIRRLAHLPPAGGSGRVWLERFSPLFDDPSIPRPRNVRAERSYSYVYPPSVDVDKVAYFFDYEIDDTVDPLDPVIERTNEWVAKWQATWRHGPRPTLTYRSAPGFLQVDDLRRPEEPGTYTLRGELAAAYAFCSDRPHTVPKVVADLELAASIEELEVALDQLCEQGIMMRDGEFFLALALPATAGR